MMRCLFVSVVVLKRNYIIEPYKLTPCRVEIVSELNYLPNLISFTLLFHGKYWRPEPLEGKVPSIYLSRNEKSKSLVNTCASRKEDEDMKARRGAQEEKKDPKRQHCLAQGVRMGIKMFSKEEGKRHQNNDAMNK